MYLSVDQQLPLRNDVDFTGSSHFVYHIFWNVVQSFLIKHHERCSYTVAPLQLSANYIDTMRSDFPSEQKYKYVS